MKVLGSFHTTEAYCKWDDRNVSSEPKVYRRFVSPNIFLIIVIRSYSIQYDVNNMPTSELHMSAYCSLQ